jgi:hypothetical protein
MLLLLLQPPKQKHLFYTFSGDIVLLIHGSLSSVFEVLFGETFSEREKEKTLEAHLYLQG